MQRYIDFDNKLVLRHKISLEIERECIQRFFDVKKTVSLSMSVPMIRILTPSLFIWSNSVGAAY